MKLERENVEDLERKIIDELDLWEADEKESLKLLAYISGVHDMANVVISAILDMEKK